MTDSRCAKSEPKYISIYKELKGRIISSDFTDGGKLPAESQLMEQYDVSRTTIRRATEMLRAENLIESRQGRGTEIKLAQTTISASRMSDVVGVEFDFTVPQAVTKHSDTLIDTVPVNAETADALGLALGDNAYRIRWLHYVNDQPYLYLTNYVRMDLAPTLPETAQHLVSLYPMLAREYGLIFEHAKETIEPIVSDFISAKLLDVPANTPLLLLSRRAEFNKGPAEYSRSIIRPDLLRISLNIK